MPILGWLLFFVAQVSAHDYWLEARPPQVEVNGESSIQLMFGSHFAGGIAKPMEPKRTGEYRLYAQRRKWVDLNSKTADLPPFENEGTALISLERTPAQIGFGRLKFLEYAAEEGHQISDQELPVAKKKVRETYTRYLKTLVQVGAKTTRTASKIVGQKYEIIPSTNPYSTGLTQLKIKVLFDGKPAAGSKVTAIQRLNGKLNSISALTDKRGRCSLPVSQAGYWLVRSVKIVPDAPVEGNQADYHSYWASLTFGY